MTAAPRFAECSHKAEGPESTHLRHSERLLGGIRAPTERAVSESLRGDQASDFIH